MINLFPLQLLLGVFAGWVNRDQAQIIDYLVEENRVLKEQLKGQRLRLADTQRRRLAAKGKILGRRLLARIATIVTPDTIMRWHKRLIAAKWTYPSKRVGRPGIMRQIRKLIVRMATDNSSWGYCRIQGELKKLDHRVARSTIANTLKDHGIPPSSQRSTSWRTFLRAHADVIAAADFFTTEVWTARGLVTHYVLFVIHHATRTVHIAGITPNPDRSFMAQVARNLTDPIDGFLHDKHYLIIDLDTKFTDQFKRTLHNAGVEVVRTAYQAPNMNALAERWILSVKSECLERMILLGEDSLRRALREYGAHFHRERPHQGLGNAVIAPEHSVGSPTGEIIEVERLGGLLRSYQRSAA
ncbi:MAG: integrase core domain-containing protein [Planctomycetota bacterium]